MPAFAAEARQFRANVERIETEARQSAAFFLMSGLDLAEALASADDARLRVKLRIERLLERERLKGVRRHWAYDLNRHIALKQALDRLRAPACIRTDRTQAGIAENTHGARRRHA